MGRPAGYTTPSDLAEYAYCPRAREYRRTLGDPPPSVPSVQGVAFHVRELRGVRRRHDRAGLYLLGAVAGVALLVLGGWGLLR